MIIVYIFGSSFHHNLSVFLTEFGDLLESTILCSDQVNQLLIAGDFNFHVGLIDNSNAHRFNKLVDRAGLNQHVRVPTHISGHTLDLIVTRNFDQLIISPSWANCLFSNHIPVPFNVQIGRPTLEKNRNLKSINTKAPHDDLSQSALCKNMLLFNLNDLVY